MDVAPRPLQFDNLPMNQPLVVHNASAPGWALPYTNATGVSGCVQSHWWRNSSQSSSSSFQCTPLAGR